ncbi:hypothetical protein Zmor_003570 [Zophobas morio]|uniref:Uncharacterized protein n=1 Tax=Zophobas morio TaxID=2755281 RepID=A0AA38HMJ3_9CUCU|nr:hypothetical protein Zmor_003570 [Zophobas morio]
MSGTVVPPGRRLPSGRPPSGSGGDDLEIWKLREDGTATREGNAVTVTTRARRFRLSTLTKKKRGDGDTISRSGAAIRKPVLRRADDPESTYGGRRVELSTPVTLLKITSPKRTAPALPHSLEFQARILFFRRGGAAIANLPPALAVRGTISGPRKFAWLQMIKN